MPRQSLPLPRLAYHRHTLVVGSSAMARVLAQLEESPSGPVVLLGRFPLPAACRVLDLEDGDILHPFLADPETGSDIESIVDRLMAALFLGKPNRTSNDAYWQGQGEKSLRMLLLGALHLWRNDHFPAGGFWLHAHALWKEFHRAAATPGAMDREGGKETAYDPTASRCASQAPEEVRAHLRMLAQAPSGNAQDQLHMMLNMAPGWMESVTGFARHAKYVGEVRENPFIQPVTREPEPGCRLTAYCRAPEGALLRLTPPHFLPRKGQEAWTRLVLNALALAARGADRVCTLIVSEVGELGDALAALLEDFPDQLRLWWGSDRFASFPVPLLEKTPVRLWGRHAALLINEVYCHEVPGAHRLYSLDEMPGDLAQLQDRDTGAVSGLYELGAPNLLAPEDPGPQLREPGKPLWRDALPEELPFEQTPDTPAVAGLRMGPVWNIGNGKKPHEAMVRALHRFDVESLSAAIEEHIERQFAVLVDALDKRYTGEPLEEAPEADASRPTLRSVEKGEERFFLARLRDGDRSCVEKAFGWCLDAAVRNIRMTVQRAVMRLLAEVLDERGRKEA